MKAHSWLMVVLVTLIVVPIVPDIAQAAVAVMQDGEGAVSGGIAALFKEVVIPAIEVGLLWVVYRVNEFKTGLKGYVLSAVVIGLATGVAYIGEKSGWDVSSVTTAVAGFASWLAMKLGVHLPAPSPS